MAKLSKAERKSKKAKKKAEATRSGEVFERRLGYDADFYADEAGREIEAVRADFVVKPEWYYGMFRAGEIHYRREQVQALCSDRQWHVEKDTACALCRDEEGAVTLLSDAELKESWKRIATSTSRLDLGKGKRTGDEASR